ncbi:MAG: hypothetical protein ACI81T_003863, partial [Bacteroidia bacterium]
LQMDVLYSNLKKLFKTFFLKIQTKKATIIILVKDLV